MVASTILALLLALAIYRAPVVLWPSGEGGDVWVLQSRPVVRGFGSRGSQREGEFANGITASDTGLRLERVVDGKTYTNSTRWTAPPTTLSDGQMVRIELSIANNGAPYVQNLRTKFYARCCAQGTVEWGIAHDQKYRLIEFAFEPDGYTQTSGKAILRFQSTADDYGHQGAEVLYEYVRGGQPPAPAPTPTPAPGPAPTPSSRAFEINIDRPGGDYRNFNLPAPDPKLCAAQCAAEGECRAWTYVKPGVQGPEPRCWLKNQVPLAVPRAEFAVSGVRPGGPDDRPLPPNPDPKSCAGFSGVWRSPELGRLLIWVEGDRVRGEYDRYAGGKISGVVLTDYLIEGEYSVADGRHGTFRFELSADGKTFRGIAETVGWGGNIAAECESGFIE